MRNQESSPSNPSQEQTGHRFLTPRRILAIGIPVCLMAGCTAGVAGLVNVGTEASADLNQSQTESHASVLAFNPKQELVVAEMYAKERFTASHIPYRIDTKPIDIIQPDPEVNKELNGLTREEYQLPFTALSKPVLDKKTGKTMVVVDRSKVTETTSWLDTPYIQNFTYDGDKKNFDHANGFRANAFEVFAKMFSLVQQDTFNNTYDALDTLTDHAIAVKALDNVNKACTPQLKSLLEGSIRKALKANVASLNKQNPNDLEVTFTPGDFKWTEEKLPEPVLKDTKKYDYVGNITVDKNFQVDSMDCKVPKDVAMKENEELQAQAAAK